jgi:hypothetical protein
MSRPLRVAVVGHTNVGKTSLLRTLLRDAGFGSVSRAPGTTRHVEAARLQVDGEALLELFDTPGLEEPIALLERLDGYRAADRLDPAARVEHFLADGPAVARFEQEAKVLRQLRQCDAGLVVIDVRDRVLAKHRDELQLLAACAVPLLPVFNFVRAEGNHEPAWREALARSGLHAMVRFDSVAPEHDAEARLYAALGTLVERARAPLQRLLDARGKEAREREAAARALIAAALIDVAAARRMVPVDIDPAPALAALGDAVRALERGAIEALLRLHQFDAAAVDAPALPLVQGRWAYDLFEPAALGDAGITLGRGMAAGAAAGVGVDLAFAGISLGAATVVGALAGGGVQALRHLGRRALGRLRGRRELSVDEPVLRLLAIRLLHLHEALTARGHATQAPIALAAGARQRWQQAALPAPLRRARAHPAWSSLSELPGDAAGRAAAIAALAEALADPAADQH